MPPNARVRRSRNGRFRWGDEGATSLNCSTLSPRLMQPGTSRRPRHPPHHQRGGRLRGRHAARRGLRPHPPAGLPRAPPPQRSGPGEWPRGVAGQGRLRQECMGDPPPPRPARTPRRPRPLGTRRRAPRPPQPRRATAPSAPGAPPTAAPWAPSATDSSDCSPSPAPCCATEPSTTRTSPERKSPPDEHPSREPSGEPSGNPSGEPQSKAVGSVGNAPLPAPAGKKPPSRRRVFQVPGKSLPLHLLPGGWPLLPPRFPRDATFHRLPGRPRPPPLRLDKR